MAFYIFLWITLTALSQTTAQRNCNDLQNPDTLVDGDSITLTEACLINTTSILTLNVKQLTIDGQGHSIDFITTQPHLFHISNGTTLTLQNVQILSPTKHDTPSITSIFYVSNNSSLFLDSVQFTNNIGSADDYLYSQYIIYSPQSDASSSLTIHNSSFDSAFAVQNDAIFMFGTESDECPPDNPCCTSQIAITNTVFDDISQSLLTAFCSEVSISNTSITGNTITTTTNNNPNDDCLLCLGYNTVTTMRDNIFDNNEGIMIYAAYRGSYSAQSSDYILTLNIENTRITSHQHTAIVVQSNTQYPSQITLSNLVVQHSVFSSLGFLALYPNTNSNIRIINAKIDDNDGVFITSKASSKIDPEVFDSCLDEYDVTQTGLWIIDSQFTNNNGDTDPMFDIQHQRVSLNRLTFINNSWNGTSPFHVIESSLFVSEATIQDNSDDAFDGMFSFDNAQSLCFGPAFMFYAFGVNAASFSLDDLFAFTNTIANVKGVGISGIQLDNCDSNTILDPISVQYLKLSHFNATNCRILSTNVSRDDDGVTMDFYDGVFTNSSLAFNLHLNDRISITNCQFYASYIELSSGVLSDETTANLTYGMIDTNVVIDTCYFTGHVSTEMIQIHAKDEWLPSITFINTRFNSISRDTNTHIHPVLLISTQIIGNIDNNETNDELPLGQSSIQFIGCAFTHLNSHLLTVFDEAIYSNQAPLCKVRFQECQFTQLNTRIIHDEFRTQAAVKFDFRSNEFNNISAFTETTNTAMLHFHGYDCDHTGAQLLDNDISFSSDIFQFIDADRSLIHGSCINLGMDDVFIDSNTANTAYGVSVTKSNMILSFVVMSNNINSVYGGIYCYSDPGDVKSCNLQIIRSTFIQNQATYGGVISFRTSHDNITEYTAIHMYNTRFVENTATAFGGAMFIEDVMNVQNNATLKLNNVNFHNNKAVFGGALYVKESAVDCKHCVFGNNTASQYGGAVMMQSDVCLDEDLMHRMRAYPKLILQQETTLMHNDALIGGGLALICYDLRTLDVVYDNNGNEDTARGGAIFAHKTCFQSVQNNTFSHNTAQFGGGIAVSAPLALGCPNNITQNRFIDNIGTAQTGGILITTSLVNVHEYDEAPTHDEFNITFVEEWFDDTSWVFEIYDNIFESNLGGNHGGAILISPADFLASHLFTTTTETPAIDSNTTANDQTNHTDDDHEHEETHAHMPQTYFIDIYKNAFRRNEITNSESDNFHGGGAIAWLLDFNSSAAMNVSDCVFIGNEGNNGQGGAIWVSCFDCTDTTYPFEYYSASYDISREHACEFCSYNEYETGDAELVIHDLYFVNNTAIAGGAIAITCIGQLSVSNIEFENHYASFYGGTVYLHQLGQVMMDEITIQHTSTKTDGYVDSKGGAVYGSCILDTIVIANTKIWNAASIIGGAVFFYETPSIYLDRSSFTSNSATLAGGCLAIFTPGIDHRNITITNVKFKETLGSALGSTIYIGSYRDIIVMFNGHSGSIKDDTYPPLFDVWDWDPDLGYNKRRIIKKTEKEFSFHSVKYEEGHLLTLGRIVLDIDIESDYAQFVGTPLWKEAHMVIYDASGTPQAAIDFERSFGNVVFLEDAYFEDVNEIDRNKPIVMTAHDDYVFEWNANKWLDALDKNTTKNITVRYDMIALIENEYMDDDGSIEVQFDNCSFIENGVAIDSVIGNVFVDDPFGIATITSINNQFIFNEAKVGSTLVHLSGYRLYDDSPIDLTSNNEDVIINCTFINNTASDTGNVIIHNADVTFHTSICDSNTVGLDGSCIATYSSTLDMYNALIVNSVMQVSGAIYSDLSILRVQDANFTNNIAKYGDGSCIYAQRMIPLVLGDCPPTSFDSLYEAFSNNDTAHEHYLFSVFDCIFDSNKAYNGSGGAIYLGTDYDTRLLNTTCLEYTSSIYEEDTAQTSRRLLQFNDTDSPTLSPSLDTFAPSLSPTDAPTAADCIDIRIVPDLHVSDISWTLRGLHPNGSFTNLHVNGTGIPSSCIANVYNDSCVEFTINDSFEDGLLYGQGTWSIEWMDEEWISPSGGNYYDTETLQICVSSVYEEEEPTSIDIVVSIIDDTNSLDFIMAFLDDIVPKFDDRIESELVFTNIGNRDIENYLFDNNAAMCINNEAGTPVYCSDYGNEAIIDALAVLCIWQHPSNHTWFDDFQDYWGDANDSYSASFNDSASFDFLATDCDLVDLQLIDGKYQLISGVQLLNKSFQLFQVNYVANDDENVEMMVPQIGGALITSSDPWINVWDANTQTVCEYYNANPTVVELICDNIEFNIRIKPPICQYESCRATRCSAEDAIIVYNSDSQRLFEEDAESFAFDTGPDVYEIVDLEYVMIGEFGLEVECYGNYIINQTQVLDKGVVLFSNSTCDHHSFAFRLQNAGARAVIIGEDVAIPQTPAPTLSPTLAPTTTALDRLWVFLNATLNGINITFFEQKMTTFVHVLNESLLVPVSIPHYTIGRSINEIKMMLFLDATNAFELWSSLNGDGSEMYLQLLKWTIQLEVEDNIHPDASFSFMTEELKLSRIEPTPRPTPEPTPMPTPQPTVQTIYIPVRVLDGPTGRRFAETAYFMSILNYTNPDPYVSGNESDVSIVAGVNDLKVSFLCNITLPTPQPTPEPTEPEESDEDSKTYLSDEISIYGFNSHVDNTAEHPQPDWIVLLSEHVLNATCVFVDKKNDKFDNNDTSECKPRLDHLYHKCLMEVAVNEDGTYVQQRDAQIETITFPVDTLCIYHNIGENPGFLVPDSSVDDTIDLQQGEETEFALQFEQDADANLSRPCQSKYKHGNGLVHVNNLKKGTYCFFIDEHHDHDVDVNSGGHSYELIIKPVYKWIKPFMQIYQSIFIDNMARKNGGAVVISAESGSIGDYSSMMIKDCAFYANNASRGLGGAVYKSSAVDNLIQNVMAILMMDNITDNEQNSAGYYGGSIAITSPEYSNIWRSAVLMNHMTFKQNFAVSYGGAIYSEWSNLFILDCTFAHNEVVKSGGAIYLVHSGFGVLDSEFLFNQAINMSSDNDQTRDKNVRFEFDNDGGAVFSSFYDQEYGNPPCIGFHSIFLHNNTAGNVGGALWLGLYGNEAERGLSCIKLSNIKFGNATYDQGGANKAHDGGRAIFLNVSTGIHPILFGETSVTQLCFTESNICKQFESTVYHMCVQPYEVAAGLCNVNITFEIDRRSVDWVDTIDELSLAGNEESIEMFPGDSKMFQVFGWDVYGNKLLPNEWIIDVSTTSDVIDLTETIYSPVFDSWLFPLFTQAATVGDEGSGKIFDLNGVALDLLINIVIVNCSDGYQYTCLNCNTNSDDDEEESFIVYTCTPCSSGTYIMNSNNCTACDLGLECLGRDNVKIAQYWYGKPQSDGHMALQLCPPGVCCSVDGGCYFHNKKSLCSLNRNSTVPLCGACLEGYTETSSAAGACGVCPPTSSLIFLLPALAGFLLVVFYLRKLSEAKQDIPHPLMAYAGRSVLFVYQLLPTLTFQSSSTVFAPLSALSNFEIDQSSNKDGEERAGTCYFTDMGPRDKIGIGLIPSFMFLGQLLLLYLIYRAKIRFKPPAKWSDKDRSKWDMAFYQTFWQLAIMLYAKVTISLLKLTDCRSVGEFGIRMWYAGSIECWDAFHYVAWFCLSMMFLTPFLVVYILRKEYMRHDGDLGKGWKYLRRRYPALVMPYRRKRYWYAAWNLARRFILIGIASIPTQRPDYSASSLAVVVGFVLGFHIYYRPFYHEINNKLESFSLGCALAVSILNIMLNKPLFFNTLTAVLAFAPLAPIPFLMYQFAVDKAPITIAVTQQEQVDKHELDVDDLFARRAGGFGTKSRQQQRQDDFLQARTMKIQQKQQEKAWKSVFIPGGRTLHVIKKRDMEDEDGVDAFSTRGGRGRSNTLRSATLSDEEKAEFYPSDDDRSWSGRSHESLTAEEDFIDEELDERTLMQVLRGKKVIDVDQIEDLLHGEEEDSSQDDEDDMLADNEIRITTGGGGGEGDSGAAEEEESQDHLNDYYYNRKHGQHVVQEKTLFGGMIKLKVGLKEEKRLMREQREMMIAAQERREKEAQEKEEKRRAMFSDPFTSTSAVTGRQRMMRRGQSRKGGLTLETAISLGDMGMSSATPGSPRSLATPGIMIEMPGMRKSRSFLEGVDPFEEERKSAAQQRKIDRQKKRARKRKLEEERRRRAEEEKKRREESAKQSHFEKLALVWTESKKVASVSEMDGVAASAMQYLEDEEEESVLTEDDEEDDIPANELLDDDGAAVTQQAIMNTMDAILDVAFGVFDFDEEEDDADQADSRIMDVDMDEIMQEAAESSDHDVSHAVHAVLGSNLSDLEAAAILKKQATKKTKEIAKTLELMEEKEKEDEEEEDQGFEVDMDVMEEAMDMVMEMQDDEEEESDLVP